MYREFAENASINENVSAIKSFVHIGSSVLQMQFQISKLLLTFPSTLNNNLTCLLRFIQVCHSLVYSTFPKIMAAKEMRSACGSVRQLAVMLL